MTKEELKKESMRVVHWMLGHRFEFDTRSDFIVIHTPFENIMNDQILFYLEETEHGYRLSDDVDTFTELGVTGFDIFRKAHTKKYFEKLIMNYHVQFTEGTEELYTEFTEIEELPRAIERLNRCIESVYTMYRIHIYEMKEKAK